MSDNTRFRVELQGLDRVGTTHLPHLITTTENVIHDLSRTPDALPLHDAFPNVTAINEGYALLRYVLTRKHIKAADVLQGTAAALHEIAVVYRAADGQY
jgi:hypothetical protein